LLGNVEVLQVINNHMMSMYTVTANTKWCDGPSRTWSTITLDWHGANIKTEFAAVPNLVP